MKSERIKIKLFFSILILSLVPLATAYLFLNETVDTAINLGFNNEISGVLDNSQENLRKLRRIDPGGVATYQEQYQKVTDLQNIYGNLPYVKTSLSSSLKAFFFIGLLLSLAVSIFAAAWLSRQISRSYSNTLERYLGEKAKTQYLEDIASWQDIARRLAHEIKNPLTPIEVTISELHRSSKRSGNESFALVFDDAHRVILEEVGQLKRLVNSFSEFARLPEVKLERIDFVQLLKQFENDYSKVWPSAKITSNFSQMPDGTIVMLDRMLFRQVMSNLFLNALEANPSQDVHFEIQGSRVGSLVVLSIFNRGINVPHDILSKVFSPYFSTKKSSSTNFGLGLAIVKKNCNRSWRSN